LGTRGPKEDTVPTGDKTSPKGSKKGGPHLSLGGRSRENSPAPWEDVGGGLLSHVKGSRGGGGVGPQEGEKSRGGVRRRDRYDSNNTLKRPTAAGGPGG